jgi:excisionase family DNA binding protein
MPLKTVLAYLRQGRLPGIKIGKHWRVPRADLEAWFAEGRQGRPSVQRAESSPFDAINANIAHLPWNLALWPLVERYTELVRQPIPAR